MILSLVGPYIAVQVAAGLSKGLAPWLLPSCVVGSTTALSLPLADTLPQLTIGEIGLLVLGLVTLAIIFTIVTRAKNDLASEITKAVMANLQQQPATRVEQPIKIEHVDQFVRVESFEAKVGEIEERFGGIGTQIASLVEKLDRYIHDMRHDVKGDFQAVQLSINEGRQVAQNSASKAHVRIDALAASVGEVRGELKQISANLAILLQGGARKS